VLDATRGSRPDGLRQARRLHHRRQMSRIPGEKVVGAGLAVDVVLGEVELRRTNEDARGYVVDAWLDDMKLDHGHGGLPSIWF
jgi:hypothetical protein